jgi:ApbE superfamily uncharacterized protein (UPF0280 family)
MSAARPLAEARRLAGNRLHLQDGPIDLVIGAEGEPDEIAAAYAQAAAAFDGLLAALVAELPLLRTPVPVLRQPRALDRHPREGGDPSGVDGVADGRSRPHTSVTMDPRLRGDDGKSDGDDGREDELRGGSDADYLSSFRHPVARAMAAACLPHAGLWVTPMAAVAGAVADHVLRAMAHGRRLAKAWVNDGGDVAFHLAPGAAFELGLVTDLAEGAPGGQVRIGHESPVRGAATSGRQGRSLSRGIADAVTVLARTAAEADVAATLIANAVDLEDHPAVVRRRACDLVPDSDLGALPVVVAVGPLAPHEVERALAAGAAPAAQLQRAGLIEAALLTLRGRHRALPTALPPATTLREPAAWS